MSKDQRNIRQNAVYLLFSGSFLLLKCPMFDWNLSFKLSIEFIHSFCILIGIKKNVSASLFRNQFEKGLNQKERDKQYIVCEFRLALNLFNY